MKYFISVAIFDDTSMVATFSKTVEIKDEDDFNSKCFELRVTAQNRYSSFSPGIRTSILSVCKLEF